MNNNNKGIVLLVAGAVLIAVGASLVVAGLAGLNTPIVCTINGCPSIFSSYYAIYWDEIYIGLALIVSGIGMVIASRYLKSREIKMSPKPRLA